MGYGISCLAFLIPLPQPQADERTGLRFKGGRESQYTSFAVMRKLDGQPRGLVGGRVECLDTKRMRHNVQPSEHQCPNCKALFDLPEPSSEPASQTDSSYDRPPLTGSDLYVRVGPQGGPVNFSWLTH